MEGGPQEMPRRPCKISCPIRGERRSWRPVASVGVTARDGSAGGQFANGRSRMGDLATRTACFKRPQAGRRVDRRPARAGRPRPSAIPINGVRPLARDQHCMRDWRREVVSFWKMKTPGRRSGSRCFPAAFLLLALRHSYGAPASLAVPQKHKA